MIELYTYCVYFIEKSVINFRYLISAPTLPGSANLTTHLQGVSEFDQQTFRAHSTIKNKHKTFNTDGVKNA
jgi:hypothetical protein